VGVAVLARWGSVGGPTGVRNTGMRLKGLGHVIVAALNEFLQLGDFANLLECTDFVLLVAIHGHTGGIITTVLQS
jgi:hypothetical protein